MALSSSVSALRRIFGVAPSPFLLQRFSPNLRSYSAGLFDDDNDKDKNLPPLTTPKLFISGLSRMTTDEKLKGAFENYGELLEAKVITDKISGRSKGFGFVTYSSIEAAEEARRKMNASFLDGWVIFVDPAKPRERRPPPPPSPQQQEPTETGFRTNKTIGWCG